MGKKLILLFNHILTEKQFIAAQQQLGIKEIIETPLPIKGLWAAVPPRKRTAAATA